MKPYPYQTECVNEIDQFNGRVLCSLDMGLGKTVISLWWLQRHPESLPAVVICPASVKYHWEHEAITSVGIRASVLEGRKPKRSNPSSSKIVIINYDILQGWLEWLREMKPQTIIIDECQFVSNPETIRAKATKLLCKRVPFIHALSGTPLVNRPIELQPTLNILCPKEKEFRSRWTYGCLYCTPERIRGKWEFKGATKLKRLNYMLEETCMIRRRKADVLKELPPKVRNVLPIPLSNPSEYRRARIDFLTWLEMKDPTKVAAAKRAETLVKLGYLKRLAARLKLRYIVDWTNQFLADSDEKLILFAVHQKMIDALKRQVKAESVIIDGRVVGRKRKLTVDQFQHDNRIRVLIGNIQAAGVGITLTAASTVAFTELAWRPADHTQAEDRIHRIGQKETSFIYYLVARGTIEEKLCEVIQEKQKVISAVLDGEELTEDLDVFDQLLNNLREEK